nr:EamA-like transporter family [uncultured bacterium]
MKTITRAVALGELLLAQTTIGVAIVASKYLLQIFPIYLLLGIRFGLSTCMMLLLAWCTGHNMHQNKDGNRLSKKDFGVLFAQAVCAGFLFNILINTGLTLTTATMAGIINSTVPAMIAVFSYALLKEKLSKQQTIGIALAIIGLLILTLGKGNLDISTSSLYGNLLIILAVFPEALFTVIAKWHGDHVKPNIMALYVCLFNALLFAPFALWQAPGFDFGSVTAAQWWLIILYSFTAVVFYVCWYRGLEHHTAGTAALMSSFMPVATTILAITFLSESVSMIEMTGMLLVIASIIFGSSYFSTGKETAITASHVAGE